MTESTVVLIKRPTLRLHANDDVIIAAKPLAAGTRINEENMACTVAIPAGHKLAVRPVAVGAPVRRYNQIIGFATQPIASLIPSHAITL
jgi:altronate hydrolase